MKKIFYAMLFVLCAATLFSLISAVGSGAEDDFGKYTDRAAALCAVPARGVKAAKGDVNGDGKFDSFDLTLLARHVARIECITDEGFLFSADVSHDGIIDAADLTLLARFVAKIITIFDMHTPQTVLPVAPTCTESGLSEGCRCALCGEVLTEQTPIQPLGHDYDAVVTAPTCTKSGYTTHTCTRCGDSYRDGEIAALKHLYEDGHCVHCGKGPYQKITWAPSVLSEENGLLLTLSDVSVTPGGDATVDLYLSAESLPACFAGLKAWQITLWDGVLSGADVGGEPDTAYLFWSESGRIGATASPEGYLATPDQITAPGGVRLATIRIKVYDIEEEEICLTIGEVLSLAFEDADDDNLCYEEKK